MTEPYSPTQEAPAAMCSKREHVEQRHLDDDGVPHLGVLGQLDAHEQAAVGAAHDAEAARGGDLAGEQILADGGEVVVDDAGDGS